MRPALRRFLIAAAALSVSGVILPAAAGTLAAHAIRPNCDVDCSPSPLPPSPPPPPQSPPPPPPPSCTTNQRSAQAAPFFPFGGINNANDVATGSDGSVWYLTSTAAIALFPGTGPGGSVAVGGQKLAIDPSGHPWIVDFNGNIWRSSAGGQLTMLPGLAHDIGIGANGAVWIIGTNSRNGSFQVYSWNGSGWTADPGSGESIDVDPAGRPLVSGVDGKIWIKDGGTDQGWTQLSGFADDIGVTPLACDTLEPGVAGGPALWIVGHLAGGGTVWNFLNGTWAESPNVQSGTQIAVDINCTPWAVDTANELLRGNVNC